MSRCTVIIIFIVFCLLDLHQAINANTIPKPELKDDMPMVKGEGRGGIDLQCTVKCTEFWLCKTKCLFMCNCDEPEGCDCNNWGR